MTKYELFIGGLNRAIEPEHLVEAFENFGKTTNVGVHLRTTRRGKSRSGFVTYGSREEAETAIKRMNGQKFRGCKLTVQYARTPRTKVEQGSLTGHGDSEVQNRVQNLPQQSRRGVKRSRKNDNQVHDGGGDYSSTGFTANKE